MKKFKLQELCQWVAPHLVKERTISVEIKMLSTVWMVSNTESFRSVADRFGFNKGTLHRVVMSVCKCITSIRDDVISWPTTNSQYQTLASDFEKVGGIPGVIGAIDGTHIRIPGPSDHRDAYINRKGTPSIQLQVVCDSKMQFLDVYTGWPGSVHDSRVFNNSPLKSRLEELPSQFHLLGDSAYALNQYLLVPFRDNGHLIALEKNFNKVHSSTRVEIEMAIGLLKGKFRRLKFLEMYNILDSPYIIFSACALHNFILKRSDLDLDEIEHDNEQAGGDVETESVATHNAPAAARKRLDIAERLI